jgi:hypothetical protein
MPFISIGYHHRRTKVPGIYRLYKKARMPDFKFNLSCHTPNRQKLSYYCMNDSNYDNFLIPKYSSKIAVNVNGIAARMCGGRSTKCVGHPNHALVRAHSPPCNRITAASPQSVCLSRRTGIRANSDDFAYLGYDFFWVRPVRAVPGGPLWKRLRVCRKAG